MKVLVACEFSGIVRDAFTAAGHDATSCDFQRSETPGVHVLGDVLKILDFGWDLIIAHPPCTYLASSGARWWPNRIEEQHDALTFVYQITQADCPRIAIENPVGRLSAEFRKPDQIIQPWQFGHPEWKTTCLWLKGLPKLEPTAVVAPDATVGGGKKPGRISSRLHRMGPSAKRQRERSRTYTGIAAAMALQWGGVNKNGHAWRCGCPRCREGLPDDDTCFERANEFCRECGIPLGPNHHCYAPAKGAVK